MHRFHQLHNSSSERKIIVLAEWNWHGHHPTYFRHYLQSLLRSGSHILALCPAPESLSSEPLFAEALQQGRLKFGVLQARRRKIRPTQLRETVRTFEVFKSLKVQISAFEKHMGQKVALIFFACIYESEFESFPYIGWLLSRPISGLSLYSSMFRIPSGPNASRLLKVLRGQAFKSIAVLDEGTSEAFETSIRKRVVVFPEITDLTPPTTQTAIARRMIDMAAGRPIIGALGYLHPYKGISTLARVALESPQNVLFAFVGEIPWSAYSSQDRQILENAMNQCENVFLHPIRVSDGIEFNSAVGACDIVYAAYHDFPNSSNILTKAALTKKEVIVSDGYLMAERTRKYNLGAVVPQKDSAAVQRAMASLLDRTARRYPSWERYLADNSDSSLDIAFDQILQVAGIHHRTTASR